MNYRLLRWAYLGSFGLVFACAPANTQIGSNGNGTGGATEAVGGGGAASEGGSGGATDAVGGTVPTTPLGRAVQLMREKHPECESYLSPANPQLKNGIIRFDCGAAVDGPEYFYRLSDGSLISTCGGACMRPDEHQKTVCQTLCPPPEFGDRCVAATGSTAEMAPCTEVNLCISDSLDVSSTDGIWACQGIDGSDLCRGTVYQSFIYEDEQVSVQLFFSPTVVDNYSTESFRAALTQYIITLKLPDWDRPIQSGGETADFTSQLDGTDAEDLGLVYSGGKLTVNLRAKPVRQPYFWVEVNDDRRCLTDDMLGICVCAYPVEPELYLELSLPVQKPQ